MQHKQLELQIAALQTKLTQTPELIKNSQGRFKYNPAFFALKNKIKALITQKNNLIKRQTHLDWLGQ